MPINEVNAVETYEVGATVALEDNTLTALYSRLDELCAVAPDVGED